VQAQQQKEKGPPRKDPDARSKSSREENSREKSRQPLRSQVNQRGHKITEADVRKEH